MELDSGSGELELNSQYYTVWAELTSPCFDVYTSRILGSINMNYREGAKNHEVRIDCIGILEL